MTKPAVIKKETVRSKAEFGDFQTPPELAQKICGGLKEKGLAPKVFIEPTFGQGNFIRAALETFSSIQYLYGIEIHKPYYISACDSILPICKERNIHAELILDDVFRFSFDGIAQQHQSDSVLILGNPPWVTNSFLSAHHSENLPQKKNIKNAAGLDAMTGKGNFDIGESVLLKMLQAFSKTSGHIALLVKNIVTKNILRSQKQFAFPLSDIQQVNIDSKKEFNASVDAGLFFAQLGKETETVCTVTNSFAAPPICRFGWIENKFAADIDSYRQYKQFDGTSPHVWRQGLKHDCSSVMELTPEKDGYRNHSGEKVVIEEGIVYPLLKSSGLKLPVITETKRAVIVPQRQTGQSTEYLVKDYPMTFAYLDRHRSEFEQRKSSIYRQKPPFSIFGIGEYSFKPYKVAVSGLYKQCRFSLVLPQNGKAVMLDDTCYFLGFDHLSEAVQAVCCLNQPPIQGLLKSLIFWNDKRVITKELLMRLDYTLLLFSVLSGIIPEFVNAFGLPLKPPLTLPASPPRIRSEQKPLFV